MVDIVEKRTTTMHAQPTGWVTRSWDGGRNQPSALLGGKDDHDLTRQDRLGLTCVCGRDYLKRRSSRRDGASKSHSLRRTESRPLLSVQEVPLAIQQAPLLFQRPFALQ